MTTLRKFLFWPLAIAGVLCAMLLASGLWAEWWDFAILKNTQNYPFRTEGAQFGWHYRDANTYAISILVENILFTAALGFVLWSLYKKRYARVLGGIGLCLIIVGVWNVLLFFSLQRS